MNSHKNVKKAGMDNCKYCGKPFTKKHYNEKYCSDECRKLSKKELDKTYKTRKTTTVKCAYCGEIFQQEHANEKYCSDRCRESAKLEQVADAAYRHYHKYKWRGGNRTWGVGTSGLGGHRQGNFEDEKEKINNEFRRIGLSC